MRGSMRAIVVVAVQRENQGFQFNSPTTADEDFQFVRLP